MHVQMRKLTQPNLSSQRGPLPEQRLQQRLRDVYKGFAYFDTFEEIKAWSVADVDPLQVSNTPRLIRSAGQAEGDTGPKTSILLCHDYSGGYHDYESVRPTKDLDGEFYSSGYLQHIEFFVYFSHKLVCVPPPTWTNSMHRNGVKILGTFMLEPGMQHVGKLLERSGDGFVVANQLTKMSRTFGFDGWLLNIEMELPSSITDVANQLIQFVESLRRMLGDEGKVIWYDALTSKNVLEYQNALTIYNSDLALAAGALLTNYEWTIASLKKSKQVAQWNELETADIYFGIDIWAQNTNMPGPPRRTYPPNGGGGTLTGMATNLLAEHGFSSALFGPAWTHEHFSIGGLCGPPMAQAVQASMWRGNDLPKDLECDCQKGRPHHIKSDPITKSAREFPAGSSTFLWANFASGFQPFVDSDGQNRYRSKLGSMAVLPQNLPAKQDMEKQSTHRNPVPVMIGTLESWPEDHLDVCLSWDRNPNFRSDSSDISIVSLHLFKVDMAVNVGLTASVTFTHTPSLLDASVGFYLAYRINDQRDLHFERRGISGEKRLGNSTISLDVSLASAGARLVEIGSYCEMTPDMEWANPLLQVYNLVIKPGGLVKPTWVIGDMKIQERALDGNSEKRLSWTWKGERADWPEGLPWSDSGTGPFSHFLITVDGTEIGDAYCQEFPLRRGDFDQREESAEVTIIILGIFFGGESLKSPGMKVDRAHIWGRA